MANNAVKWDAAPTFTGIITSATPSDGAGALSSAVTNDVALDTEHSFRFTVDYNTTGPGSGKSLKCYILRSHDSGTTREYGSASVQPLRSPDFTVPVADVLTVQEHFIEGVLIGPHDFKLLVWDDTSQALADLDVSHAPFNREVQ